MWELNQLLFVDDTVVVADSERKLCQLVTEFGRVCERNKLRVNVGKSKVMRCTTNEDGPRLNVMFNEEALEEIDQFKYLGSFIAANGGVEASFFRITSMASVRQDIQGIFFSILLLPGHPLLGTSENHSSSLLISLRHLTESDIRLC